MSGSAAVRLFIFAALAPGAAAWLPVAQRAAPRSRRVPPPRLLDPMLPTEPGAITAIEAAFATDLSDAVSEFRQKLSTISVPVDFP
eukprot:4223102-Prymnesium_polylepis.1